jgi:peptide/nickel transport system permease protein
VLLLVMSFVIFLSTTHLPGDPAVSVLGIHSTEEQRAIVREQFGFDDPVYVQYFRWLGRALSGDLGKSVRTGEMVGEMLATRAPITIQLTIFAMVIASLVGIPAGVIAAKARGSAADLTVSTFALIASAIPFFWLGVLLIFLISVRLHWLPASGYAYFFDDPIESLRLMIMPAIAIGLSMAALITRQTRSAMLQVLNEDFVRAGRAKGISEMKVLTRHALPNAMLPVLTVIGLQTGILLGGAIVTEKVFAINGLGTMLIDGIFNRDFPVIQGSMLFIVLCVTAINLIVDLLYTVIDPRIGFN